MTRLIPLCLLLGPLSLIGGCAQSPPVRYFALQALYGPAERDGEVSQILAVGPLKIPPYLDRPQIVSRGAGAELIVDDFNRWAEPLDEALQRIVAANVDSLVDNLLVVAFPYHSLLDADYRLVGRVSRFETDYGGTTVLQVQWSVVDDHGATVLRPRRSRYVSRVDATRGVESIAASMNDVMARFSQEVAEALTQMLEVVPAQ